MLLPASSTSLSAVIAASHATLRIGLTSAVVHIVDLAYESETQTHSTINFVSSHEECHFATSFSLRRVNVDVGILYACSDPDHVCVEDILSSVGGRCVPNRKLKTTTTCDTKCTPASACEGLSQDFIDNNIGLGSCCGDKACVGVSATSTIGDESCIGNMNCYAIRDATIGDNSCNGDSIQGGDGYYGYVCTYAKGTIGEDSCYEYAACYQTLNDSNQYSFNIGDSSCRGENSCAYSSGVVIASGSCKGTYACWEVYENIGAASCNESHSCTSSRGVINDDSCNGYYSCYENEEIIGNYSCNGKFSCENNAGIIGDSKCNNDYECRSNTNPITSAPTSAIPTKKPTAKPTKNPTAKPTKKPTAKPTKKPTASPTMKDANPTGNPTTKSPTALPVSVAPTKNPVANSHTLTLKVDLCYPGCGDFTDVYTHNEFEDMIIKYTPCDVHECAITIIDASDSCFSCSMDPSRRLRFLQDAAFQSSAITFEIQSDEPLIEAIVTENLNDNIFAANEELEEVGVTFRVVSNYTEGTKAPTAQPSKKHFASVSTSSIFLYR